ncbi:MAG: hypothetical protein PHE50_06645 [Dehalococcoidales bacterium]|nr:hypothetical protein [Dehalococcoidales bacterium]
MNSKPNRPVRVEKPWGYELIFSHTDKYAGKVLFIKKGCKLSLQYHLHKDESMYIQSGQLIVRLGTNEKEMTALTLKTGDCVRIEPLKRHRLEAVEDTILFEVSTPELDDVQRLADDYGRA